MKRNRYVPLWVDALDQLARFIDYKILDRISGWLCSFRFGLVDRHCICPKCQERKWRAQ